MANYQFSSDLVNDILFRSGELTDGTSDFDSAALQYLNRAYQALWMGGTEIDDSVNEDWLWLKKDPPGILTLEPVIETGTLSVTNNSTSATFSSAPSKDLDNWFIKTTDHADVFRISAHTASDTAVTLDSVYTGATDTAASYKAFKLEYSLASDVLKIIAPMRSYQDGRSKIEGRSLEDLELDWPLRLADSGIPNVFAMVSESKVRFNKYGGTSSTDLIRLEYDYLRQPADLTDSGSEEPAVPHHYRRILSDVGVAFLFMDKNDDRADFAFLLARRLLKAMETENRQRLAAFSRSMMRIFPRPRSLPVHTEPLRTSSGLIVG